MDHTSRSVAKERTISPPMSQYRGDLGQNLTSQANEENFYSDVYTLSEGRLEQGSIFQSDNSQNKWPSEFYSKDVSAWERRHLYDKIREENSPDEEPPDYELARNMGGIQSKSYSLFSDEDGGRRVRLISSTRNRDNRPPAKVPIVIDKNKLPPLLVSNNNDIPQKSAADENGYTSAFSKEVASPKVRLGDYTQPVDATNFTWGRNDEYCEPYVAEQLIQEATKRRQSSTTPDSKTMDVESDSTDYNRINRSDIPKPSNTGASDGYDHAKHWTNPSPTDPSSGTCTYEDPWDSRIKQQELQKKLGRAQSEEISFSPMDKPDQRRYSHDRTALRRKPQPSDMYEDAWDTAERQRKLQEKLSAAQRPGGANRPPVSPPPFREHWDIKQRPMDIESRLEVAHIHDRSPVSPTRKSPTARSPTVDTYEEAWDLNARAKALSYLRSNSNQDRELLTSPHSPSSGSPTHRLTPPRTVTNSCTIGERINPILPLHKQSWYHGRIPRAHAEHLLRVCKEGSYLVRESESDRQQYSLSLKSSVMNIHIRITRKLNDKYILGENSADFNSIPEMVDYYTSHQVPLKGATHLTLLHPVEKH